MCYLCNKIGGGSAIKASSIALTLCCLCNMTGGNSAIKASSIATRNIIYPSTTMLKYIQYLMAMLTCCVLAVTAGCNDSNGKATNNTETTVEDTAAKREMQGVWLNDADGEIAFRLKGDSVYFADSTSVPAYFCIINDTLMMKGANTVRYRVKKRTPHSLTFINSNGEEVNVVKTDDASYLEFFEHKKSVEINQNKVVKSDTVVYDGERKFHCYTQVNPTTYKVLKASTNTDGMEVNNVYFDNIINLNIFQGQQKLFSRDYKKEHFKKDVPEQFLKQSVLSNIRYYETNDEGLHFFAEISIPETYTSYLVEIVIGYDGKETLRVKK